MGFEKDRRSSKRKGKGSFMKKIIYFLFFIGISFSLFADIGTKGFHEFSNNRYFVETGTFGGGAVFKAVDAGFPFILSIDIDERNIRYVTYNIHKMKDQFRAKGNLRIDLFVGDSSVGLWYMIKDIQEPITFWLDAHQFPPVRNEKNCPLFEELEQIKRHPIKEHTILIDDMSCCGTLTFDYLTKEDLEKKILEINSQYEIRYIAGGENDSVPNNILVAQIKGDKDGE